MQATVENNPYVLESIDNEGIMRTATRGKRVFIVEDNEMHSMMMDYLISKENPFQIYKFKSGEECLQKLKMNPDIVILDYGLPGMNGMETFNAIKKYNSGIPIVVVTENRNVLLERAFLDAGAYEFILKESNAFSRLNIVLNSLLKSISEKEYKTQNNITLMLVGGFLMVVIIASLLSYAFIKH